jgi:hypothetical protein
LASDSERATYVAPRLAVIRTPATGRPASVSTPLTTTLLPAAVVVGAADVGLVPCAPAGMLASNTKSPTIAAAPRSRRTQGNGLNHNPPAVRARAAYVEQAQQPTSARHSGAAHAGATMEAV